MRTTVSKSTALNSFGRLKKGFKFLKGGTIVKVTATKKKATKAKTTTRKTKSKKRR